MNYILERLRVNSALFELTINIKKTNAMLIGAATNVPPCVIENSELKIVSTFEYLGRVLTRDSDDMVTLRDRVSEGWASFTKKESI